MQSLLKNNPGNNDYIHTGESRKIKGITNQVISVPLVEVHIRTYFLNETVLCGLVNELPDGVDFIISSSFPVLVFMVLRLSRTPG